MNITGLLADAAGDVVERVQRSLVVLHNGRRGVGAGVIWESAGSNRTLILTNHHVVAPGANLSAEFAGGEMLPAQLIAEDPEIDLALLTAPPVQLPAAQVADSRQLKVGELALAVGHPWGQRGMVTLGLVSSLSKARTRRSEREVDIIRSDARLAPGNSGGPLINAAGAVIGINTLVIGGDQGIAVASQVAQHFILQALKPT